MPNFVHQINNFFGNYILNQCVNFWHNICNKSLNMADLSSCEILDELKKLGIELPADLIEYLEKYTDYCHCKDCTTCPEKDK